MVDQQIVNQLKQQYGDDIYSVPMGKEEYIFRALTYHEYRHFQGLHLSSGELEDMIVLNAVIYPQPINLDKIKPGTISALSDEILEYSGFVSIDRALINLHLAREECTQAVELMKAFILSTMPTYSYEDLDHYTLKKLTKLVAVSELILQIHSGSARGEELTLSFSPPGEEPQQTKGPRSFTAEDIEKANRHSDILPDTSGFWDKGPKVVTEKGTKLGTATADDPIAHQLHQALR